MVTYPKNLKYTKTHEWIDPETGKMGLTSFAVEHLGDITMFDTDKEEGDEISQGEEIANVDSVKTASAVYAPVDGKIVSINEELEDEPELMNEEPYGKGWLMKIEVTDPSQLDALMDFSSYESHCASEED